MIIRETRRYSNWLRGLKDSRARAKILVRINRLKQGNLGDVKPVGSGVSELRLFYGPGYRVYFVQRGEALIILLAGGDKSSQKNDIAEAIELARQIDGEWYCNE